MFLEYESNREKVPPSSLSLSLSPYVSVDMVFSLLQKEERVVSRLSQLKVGKVHLTDHLCLEHWRFNHAYEYRSVPESDAT